jgi:hypothetical protein
VGQNNSGKSNALRFLQDRYRFLAPSAGFPRVDGLEKHMSKTEIDEEWPSQFQPVMFHDSLQNERDLGINFWERECPVTEGIAFTIPGPDNSKALFKICSGVRLETSGLRTGSAAAPTPTATPTDRYQ